jgi:hypothetical protein
MNKHTKLGVSCAQGAAILVFAALLTPGTALAFRNPELFRGSAIGGGGGGKYFTLSRAEGYGCAVCHSQGEPVSVQVRNLPKTGFIPGAQYRITVDWPDDQPSVALNLELTDFDGAPFGQVIAPDPLTLSPADLCPQSEAPSAGQTVEQDASGRRVLLIAECGQAQTSFDWIAPSAPAQGYFSGSITFSNRNGKLTGDSVVDLSAAFGVLSAEAPAANAYQTQCSVASTRTLPRATFVLCSYGLLITWGVLRRRSDRRNDRRRRPT